MRVLFLDIDGVLNSHAFIATRGPDRVGGHWAARDIDPAAVARLNRVLEATEALVVVSSMWRLLHRRTVLCDILGECGFKGKILGVTPRINEDYSRGREIAQWLRENEREPVTSYAVVDDDFDAGVGHGPRFVQTSFSVGMDDAAADRLISILLREVDGDG